MEKSFRHPKEMKRKSERTPVSARIRAETKEIIEREAKKGGVSLGEVIATVLDDYGAWLRKNPSK
jgi:hypothetical protein